MDRFDKKNNKCLPSAGTRYVDALRMKYYLCSGVAGVYKAAVISLSDETMRQFSCEQ